MPDCIRCGKPVAADTRICPHCGAVQSDTDKLPGDKLSQLDRLDSDIENCLENLEKDMGKKFDKTGAKLDALDTTTKKHSDYKTVDTNQITEIDITSYLPDRSDMDNFRKLVFESNLVESNAQYKSITSETRFSYKPDNPEINAYATGTALGPQIIVTGGLVREFFITSLYAVMQSTHGGNQLKTYSRVQFKAHRSLENEVNLPEGIDERVDHRVIETSQDLLGSMVVFVIAHELGHVVYGHVFGPGYDNQSIDISRNQERDADSFASSVIASSRFAPFLVQGQILALYVFALSENESGESVEPGTHPLAVERLKNAIRSNSEIAKEMGLTEAMIDEVIS